MLELDLLAQPAIDSPNPDLSRQARCGRYWAVAQTHPQAERWADQNLRRRGYQTYLPLYAVTVRDRALPSLRHTVERPLFTGYLFVVINGNWTPVRYAPGVHHLIGVETGQPNIVDNAVISALQAGEDARRSLPAENAQWAPGVPCSLAVGPFAQHPAVVTAVHGNTATVALMMLGALRDMAVPLSSLRARDE